METFGLAAFRGNGRTGDHEAFEKLHENPIYKRIDGANLKNVALMIHSQKDIEGSDFEFIYKSFGEYLTARGLARRGPRWRRGQTPEPSEHKQLLGRITARAAGTARGAK